MLTWPGFRVFKVTNMKRAMPEGRAACRPPRLTVR